MLKILSPAILLFSFFSSYAQENSNPGVNPRDNLNKNEIFYRYDHLDLGDYTQSMALKYDKAFNKSYGVNIEVPIVNFKGFGLESTGLGDVQGRVRYIKPITHGTLIGGAEIVFPTASEDILGRGKYQFNPAIGMVYQLLETSFVYIGYKHLFSVSGDKTKADIDESQPRLLAAYTSIAGWWTLSDLKYTKNWNSDQEEMDYDQEFGLMLNRNIGTWLRAGTSWLDSDRDFSVLIGVRLIH